MKMLWHRHSGTRPSYSLWIRLFSVGRRGPACSYCSGKPHLARTHTLINA
jgi:hypothetical protein